jgi:hypothetical protein
MQFDQNGARAAFASGTSNVHGYRRWLPASKETVVAILLPMAIPFLLLALSSMPLGEILSTMLSVLK